MVGDDDLELSPESLAALKEFLKEQAEAQEAIQKKQPKEMEMNDFNENWQLSQFWYNQETKETLIKEAMRITQPGDVIGCVSSPSVFVDFIKLDHERQLHVFEYDKRFNVYPEFVYYDFNEPTNVAIQIKFDVLIVDPPFLSVECWEKVIQTIRFLLKPKGKIIICTGKVMHDVITSQLDCYETTFYPKHTNGLSNEFRCFVNYSPSFPDISS